MSHHQRRRRAATAHGPVATIVQLDSMELPAMGGWRARRKRRLAQGGKGGTNWKGASMLARHDPCSPRCVTRAATGRLSRGGSHAPDRVAVLCDDGMDRQRARWRVPRTDETSPNFGL